MVFFFLRSVTRSVATIFFHIKNPICKCSLSHSGVDTVVVSRPELKNARAISRSETGNTTG